MQVTKQKGAALIIFAVIFALAATAFLVSQLDASGVRAERNKKTAAALAEAKVALIGDAISKPLTSDGLLRLPDIGHSTNPNDLSEGSSISTFTGNMKNYSVLGKLPWKTLGIAPTKDGYGECLWYVVSGNFKKNPVTDTLNWDTQGQIDVIDQNGNDLAINLAALIIAPEFAFNSQSRSLADPIYSQCGGNYDARNYLDAYDLVNSVNGELNYFSGSINGVVTTNANNKKFVFTKNDYYNDRFIFVSVDEIFNPIIRRSDFANQIDALLNDADLISIANEITVTNVTTTPPNPSNRKGTGKLGLDCGCVVPNCATPKVISNPDIQKFCKNWRDMLLLTQLPPTSSIKINGVDTPCNRLLIFGGQKTVAQVRITAANKSDPANYLEVNNLSAFDASSTDYDGVSKFSANDPSADILKCI